MNAPAKGLLKVSSILLIIFGAIGLVSSAASFACVSAAANLANSLAATATDLGADATTAAAALSSALSIGVIIALVLGIIGGAAELVFGIIGMKNYANPAKGNLFIVGGIVLCVIFLASVVLYFSWFAAIDFVLPILFIIGGFMNKKAAAAPAAPVA